MAFADNGEFNQSFSEQCWDIYKGSLYTRVRDRLTWLLNIVLLLNFSFYHIGADQGIKFFDMFDFVIFL